MARFFGEWGHAHAILTRNTVLLWPQGGRYAVGTLPDADLNFTTFLYLVGVVLLALGYAAIMCAIAGVRYLLAIMG